ncbi:MAG: 16S rRNA (cytidine(1402)-2'-O)-methyltransferase [Acidobacteriia bacterium]|nr:16S rRNA (cytidine(1402)-2'-O)-methyltransferase [Terriglobia bacterium]
MKSNKRISLNSLGKRLDGNDAKGTLYIIGTPIGNLEDITLRGMRTLGEVDLIACEDTRTTQKLLNAYKIKTPTTSYHEHNELTKAPELVLQLENGDSIGLVCDAGMPGISDPGFRLIQLSIRHNIRVVPVPGVSAFVAALVASGLPTDSFRFHGFLPAKRSARLAMLGQARLSQRTIVFYEAPHRLMATLRDMLEVLGDRNVAIAREVTKRHEEFLRGTLSSVIEQLQGRTIRGEITIIVDKASLEAAPPAPSGELKLRYEKLLAAGADRREAMKQLAREHGLSKSEVYRRLEAEKSAE